jgi:hypothetical protein
MFLARVHPVVRVYRVKGGQWKKGSAHVVNFFRDITKSFGMIPCLPTSLPMVVLRQRGQQLNDYKDFTVCLPRLRAWINFLRRENQYYHNIVIDENAFTQISETSIAGSMLTFLTRDEDLSTEGSNDRQGPVVEVDHEDGSL